MIDLNLLRENPVKIQKAAEDKGVKIDSAKILALDGKVKNLRIKIEDLRRKLNQKSKIKNQNDKEKIKNNLEELKQLKQEIKSRESESAKIEPELNNLLCQIPNLPAPDVKIGKDESENEILKKVGEPTKFNFPALDHVELGKKLGLIDLKRAAKTSGSRFYYLKGLAVKLQFALINYALEILEQEGFTLVVPPVLLNEKSMAGMGYLEHGGEEEIYYLPKDKLYLVGTSEQSIGAMHQDEILVDKQLPLLYAGYSTCFRREAGSYGKDTRGIFRVHQFDKVEMFVFCRSTESDKWHKKLLAIEEKIVQGLKIPYRVVKMCTGDLGDSAARTYDIECWLPSQNCYRETHSTSNCTDFQARRLNIHYKNSTTGKNEFVHTLNGTAIAIGRMLIAIMENYQTDKQTVETPKVIKKYLI